MTAAELAEKLDRAVTESGGIDLRDPELLRQAAARLRSMEDALKPFADRTCGFLGSVTDAHVVTARELLGLPAYRRSEQEDAARAALSGEGQ